MEININMKQEWECGVCYLFYKSYYTPTLTVYSEVFHFDK